MALRRLDRRQRRAHARTRRRCVSRGRPLSATPRWPHAATRSPPLCTAAAWRAATCVAWLGLNSPEMLATLFACARLGAIFMPLNWRLAPRRASGDAARLPAGAAVRRRGLRCGQRRTGRRPGRQRAASRSARVPAGWTGWDAFIAARAADADRALRRSTPTRRCCCAGPRARPAGPRACCSATTRSPPTPMRASTCTR